MILRRAQRSKKFNIARNFQSRSKPCPSFPCFFWKMAKKTNKKKTRICFLSLPRTPKIPGKEGKNTPKNKEILARRKNTRNSQKKKQGGKEGQGILNLARKFQSRRLEFPTKNSEGRKWGVRSVMVGFGVFGAPRFSVQRSPNTYF